MCVSKRVRNGSAVFTGMFMGSGAVALCLRVSSQGSAFIATNRFQAFSFWYTVYGSC